MSRVHPQGGTRDVAETPTAVINQQAARIREVDSKAYCDHHIGGSAWGQAHFLGQDLKALGR